MINIDFCSLLFQELFHSQGIADHHFNNDARSIVPCVLFKVRSRYFTLSDHDYI